AELGAAGAGPRRVGGRLAVVEVVGVLEGDAEGEAEVGEPPAGVGVAVGGDRAELAGGGEERAGLAAVDGLEGLEVGGPARGAGAAAPRLGGEVARLAGEELGRPGAL